MYVLLFFPYKYKLINQFLEPTSREFLTQWSNGFLWWDSN